MCSRAGRIHQYHVAPGLPGFAQRRSRQFQRFRLLGRAFINRQLDVARDHAQLLPRRGTINVDRNHDRAVPVLRKPSGQLSEAGALVIEERHNPIMVSVDVYRPAARQQLSVIARDIKLPIYDGVAGRD